MSNTPFTQHNNPFVGLRAFDESEDYLFFGRGKEIDELLLKFSENRFLAVIGSSGSGKSSLVKSGLLPAIYGGFMKSGSSWRVAMMQPGENPIGYLARQLAKEGVLYQNIKNDDLPYEAVIESRLRRSEQGLIHTYTDARLPEQENLLIVVDQFEELFRFSQYEKESKLGKSDAIHFIRILLTAARQAEYPIYILLTMRSDFLGDCAEFRGLPEAINNGQYLVPRMTRDEIREAITGPVAVSGASISQRLVTRLLNDINNDTDQLPVLQHAMMRTWDAWYKRNEPDSPIDFVDYDKIGTMNTALSQHADEAYDELETETRKKICELMFKALTDKLADLRGIRRPRSIVDLCLLTGGTQTELRSLVETFRKPGRTFLMPSSGIELTDETIIDISHESLMRIWKRLVDWTDEEARSGDLYMRLANSAQLNAIGQRGMLKDPELRIALQWEEKNKPTAKWAEAYKANFEQAMIYLADSRVVDLEEKRILAKKEAARKRMIKTIFALLGLLVVAGFIVSFILNQDKNKAIEALHIAETERANALRSDSLARLAKDVAENEKKSAQYSAAVADTAKRRADSSANIAKEQEMIAISNEKRADSAKRTAQSQTQIAENLKENAKKQAYKTAPSEYARLIREGPSDKKGILASNFDYKLTAYTQHLSNLESLIESTGDRDAERQYHDLCNRIYFNNDLYEKIYACMEHTTESKNLLFDKVSSKQTFNSDLQNSSSNLNRARELTGEIGIAFAESKTDQLFISASDDNWISIFNTSGKALVLENRIPMGTRVTALDYNAAKNIIYFGTASGDIGYINYGKDKKNQPVFENALGTPITAIQMFKTTIKGKTGYFLLAAGKKSKVVVYQLDENSPQPDKKLLGNTLPEKNLVEITNAQFDEKSNTIIIRVQSSRSATANYYRWNPFSALALDEYRKLKYDPALVERTLMY